MFCLFVFFLFTFSRRFYPKRLTIGEYMKRFILGKQTEEVLVTPSLRHCSNKYKLAREGEKDKRNVKFRMKSCTVEKDEFSRLTGMGVERSFLQPGTVNENALERDFELYLLNENNLLNCIYYTINIKTCYMYCVKPTGACYSTCVSLLFCWFWLLPL